MDTTRLFHDLDGAPLTEAAARLAAGGVPVFPCIPGDKRPLTPHGFHDATTDSARVAGWWGRWPGANIGMPTGRASGLVVVDVDVHGPDGYASYARAEQAGLLAEPSMVVRTPSGGRHVYFPVAPDAEQRSWQAGKAGIDCRADGGYIILPPSTLALDGVRVPYRLEHVAAGPTPPIDTARLRRFLDPPPPPRPRVPGRPLGRGDAERLAGWLSRQTEDRNLKLFWTTCRLAEAGTPAAEAHAVLGPAAEASGLGPREVARAIRSAYRSTTPTARDGSRAVGFDPEPARRSAGRAVTRGALS